MIVTGHAYADDRAEIAAFMNDRFARAKWGLPQWNDLLRGRWAAPDDPIAVTVRDAGKLVGAIGMVTARRSNGQVTTNLTSWYLDADYRGLRLGKGMMMAGCAEPGAAVTNLSSARAAIPVVGRAGMVVLDDTRLIWHPRPDAPRLEEMPTPDLEVLQDHAGLNVTPITLTTPDGPITLILSIKQKDNDRTMYEALWISDRPLFAKHARAIAASILPASDAVLSVDARFAPDATPDTTEPIPVARFWRPGAQPGGDVDMLYSEIVLLDMKLY